MTGPPATFRRPLAMVRRLAGPFRSVGFAVTEALGGYRDVIWVVGDGRSGTTWVSDVLNEDGRFRSVFEPLHPAYVPATRDFGMFCYARPDREYGQLEAFYRSVFDGSIRHWRVDAGNLRLNYRGLLVKDIFSHLLMGWALRRFSHVAPLLLVRHPFAVALSKQNLRDWVWAETTRVLLRQEELMEDYLWPFEDILRRGGRSYWLEQVAIWAAVHHVLFKQIGSGLAIPVVFYEDVLEEREASIRALRSAAGLPPVHDREIARLVTKSASASRTSRHGSKPGEIVSQEGWAKLVGSDELSEANEILESFGLSGIYSPDGRPNRNYMAPQQ